MNVFKRKKKQILYDFAKPLSADYWYDWTRVGGKANHLYQGSEKGLKLFDKWSQQSVFYKGYEDCAKLYYSFSKAEKTTFSSRKKKPTLSLLLGRKLCST